MAMYMDDPDDSLQDEFDAVIFSGHPLGMNILGTAKTIQSFGQRDFKKFVKENLDTRKVVFTSVGDVSMDEVIRLADRYLGPIPKMRSQRRRKLFSGYKPTEVTLQRPVKQARCAIGRAAYKLSDKKRGAFYMLTNMLGGAGMNSRLNLALRERHGYVYSVGAQFIPFTDTGLFVISFGTESSQMKKSIALVQEELRRFREEPLGVKQLAAAKEQLLGQIAMAEESNISFMMMMARSLLDLGKVLELNEVFEGVRKVTPQLLQEISNEMFRESKMSYLVMEPS
jgi:predicted Zn-dependent peptidase